MKSGSCSRFVVCFYVIASVSSLIGDAEGNFTRTTRQAKECKGFKCQTTDDCIEIEQRCDGTVDCKDGSDEANDCKTAVHCPGYLFTCDYGACLDMAKKCNGKKDCRDNSDEANCIVDTGVNKISSNCKSDQFECKSGQCISLDDKCSGTPECDDHSDETKETCLNMYCPGYTFKCDYGACTSGFARCNGIKECNDNSDEEGCAPQPTPQPRPPVPTGPVTEGCVLPPHPDHGKWIVQGGTTNVPGDLVSSNTILNFECEPKYKLLTEAGDSPTTPYFFCLQKKWSVATFPTCVRKCQPIYSTKVTNIKCYDSRNVEIKCDEATNGTSATFSCAPYYEPNDQKKSTRYCWEGSWNLPPPACQPVCGEKVVSAIPLIVNGKEVKRGNYPWVTAIYHYINATFTNVCGGSILTQKVIITAAHCVVDQNGNRVPEANMMIGVGKYHNKYQDPDDTEAQYSKVEAVIVHEFYKGNDQRYASDIALIIPAEKVALSKVVQPVCYQDLTSINLHAGLVGVVTGWGYTTESDTPSDVLLEIDVPYKPPQECFSELPKDWADKYYTSDKMCAGHYNRSIAVCKGDSGGGLVYKNPRDDRYYIHGIVSIGHTSNGGCDIQVSSLYTKVAFHYNWLEKIVSQYRADPE